MNSADDIDALIDLVASHPAAYFVGGRSPSVVAAAEEALGHVLPAGFRSFVLRLRAGSVGSSEIYGVIREPFDGPVPCAIWSTISDRSGPSNLPSTMIVIGSDGMGGSYVLDSAQGEDPPVSVWNGGRSSANDELEVIATSFAGYLYAVLEFEVLG